MSQNRLTFEILEALEAEGGAAEESKIRERLQIAPSDGERLHALGTALTHLLRREWLDVRRTALPTVPDADEDPGHKVVFLLRTAGRQALAGDRGAQARA